MEILRTATPCNVKIYFTSLSITEKFDWVRYLARKKLDIYQLRSSDHLLQ